MIDGFKGVILAVLIWFGIVIIKLEMEVDDMKKEMRKKGWDV